MARAVTPQVKARRSLVGLVLIVLALVALNFLGVLFAPGATFGAKMQSFVPKLGLDLQGGTQIILQAQTVSGQNPTADQLNQSVAIIRQRVDAGGVSEAQISTAGGKNIIVSLPGTPSQATINSVKSSARMVFRSVLLTDAASTTSVGKAKPYTPPASLATQPSVKPTNGSDASYITPYLQDLYDHYDCAQDTTAAKQSLQNPTEPLVTCNPEGDAEVPARAGRGRGHAHLERQQRRADDLAGCDDRVVGREPHPRRHRGEGVRDHVLTARRARHPEERVRDRARRQGHRGSRGQPGHHRRPGADHRQLHPGLVQGTRRPAEVRRPADQLHRAEPGHHLGDARHHAAAGGPARRLIGLLLVVVYSVLQYRTLAFVTVGSLLISGLLTYLVIDFLSWREGYRLSLAGVAGLIVSIGITADSFIVYFERIRDELREGKALVGAVEAGWRRAIRTILASDAVNFLAAAVLYVLAVGDVRGFALTLGLTTLVDVVTVTLFTHPCCSLSRAARSSPTATGSPGSTRARSAPSTAGAGQLPRARPAGGPAVLRSRGEAARRQTIAERKAAELRDQHRHDRHDPGGPGLMASFTRFGNDLYSGARSIDFIGHRRVFYLIAASRSWCRSWCRSSAADTTSASSSPAARSTRCPERRRRSCRTRRSAPTRSVPSCRPGAHGQHRRRERRPGPDDPGDLRQSDQITDRARERVPRGAERRHVVLHRGDLGCRHHQQPP